MEPFLASSVPDEELMKFISTRYSFGHKRCPNGRADVVVKVILDESTHNARFPNTSVPEKTHFELAYRHHVLGAGPGRGSASSRTDLRRARAQPASPVPAFPSPQPRAEPWLLMFLGCGPCRARSRGRWPLLPGPRA